MTRAAYFDCASGASGYMLLGALVDCGVPLAELADELASLPLAGYRLEARPVLRAGIAATKVDVVVEAGEQPHRNLEVITGIIEGSRLPASDRERALAVFTALAEAEAKVHGTSVAEVEFHEVGAVDSIVDIVGCVVGLRLLGVEQCYVSALALGGGMVRTAHGLLPVPGPATLELVTRAGAPVAPAGPDDRFELLTPTGAALLTTLGEFRRPALHLERTGYGAGGRDTPDRPNVVRIWLGESQQGSTLALPSAAASSRTLTVVETNIDDMNPELYAWVSEQLFAAGARDVWCTPIQMKKGRPAVMLQALCTPELEPTLVEVMLTQSSTLGVRTYPVTRYEAERVSRRFTSSLGEVGVKVKVLPGRAPHVAPEYEDCRRLAEESGLPLLEVYRIVVAEAVQLANAL